MVGLPLLASAKQPCSFLGRGRGKNKRFAGVLVEDTGAELLVRKWLPVFRGAPSQHLFGSQIKFSQAQDSLAVGQW
jgi:hypothetical protein